MANHLFKKVLSLSLMLLLLLALASPITGQDDEPDYSHTQEEEPFYLDNVAHSTTGATATASSTSGVAEASGTYTPSALLDGDRRGLNWGDNGGWRCATANAYPDWVEVQFNGYKTIQQIDVFTLQDNYTNPVEPTLDQTFTLLGITDFEVQYWDGAKWIRLDGRQGNRNVWTQFRFAPVTTNMIRLFITGALASYSRVTEIEVWGTEGFLSAFQPAGQSTDDSSERCEPDKLNPCEMMTSLHTVMTKAVRRSAPGAGANSNWWPKWNSKLRWNFEPWREGPKPGQYGSQNLPLMAHAIALWLPRSEYTTPPNPANETNPLMDPIAWWMKFLDCQNGLTCNVADPQTLRFIKGVELLSNTYDAESTSAVLAVRYWALWQLTLNPDSTQLQRLANKTAIYLRNTWILYSLGAGKREAKTVFHRHNVNDPNNQVCQPSYNGPYVAIAGMRSTTAHICKDDRGPLLARALHWPISPTSNWRGVPYLTRIHDFVEAKFPVGSMAGTTNIYGIDESLRTKCRAVIDPASVGQTEAAALQSTESVVQLIQSLRTVVKFRFIAWVGQNAPWNQIRVTLMESNRNHNTAAIYAVRYDYRNGSDSIARILYPWSNLASAQRCQITENRPFRAKITNGYAKLLPSESSPTSIEASSIDKNQGEVPNCVHENFVRIIDTMNVPNWAWKYHYVFSPNLAPTNITRQ